MNNIIDKAKTAAISASLNQALKYMDKDPDTNIPKIMDMVDRVTPDGWYEEQRSAIRSVIEEKNHWYDLIMKIWELDPGVRNTFLKILLSMPVFQEVLYRKMSEKRRAVMYHGRFYWIRLLPVICTARAVGQQNTEIV